jgi:hypothetical protein
MTMSEHRFLDLLETEAAVPAAATATATSGFMVCPLVLQGAAWSWQQVYQMALEQARAVVRPSILERWQKTWPN